jgi:hypothetical protein
MRFGFNDVAFVGALSGISDPDAAAYIAAVEAADGQALEFEVRRAIDEFVIGCKADGIWTPIRAACILCGARTRAGALTPLVGPVPTEHGTAGGWNYNRRTGLAANGTDNYLDSGRADNADPQDSKHVSCNVTTIGSGTIALGARNAADLVDSTQIAILALTSRFKVHADSFAEVSSVPAPGFMGASRTSSSSVTARASGTSATAATTSATPSTRNIWIFARNSSTSPVFGSHRLSFYSIGESLTLSTLDTRLATLMAAIQAAIPV